MPGAARFGEEARGVDAPRDLAATVMLSRTTRQSRSISDSCTARRPGAGALTITRTPARPRDPVLEVEVDLEPADVAF